MSSLLNIQNLFLKNLKDLALPSQARIIIAVSGGLDSVALAHLFAMTKEKHQLKLELAHITHNVRSFDAGQKDYAIILDISKRYALPLHHYSLEKDKIQQQYGKEQDLRTVRRCWLESLCSSSMDKIALAHHQNDHIETVFMRLNQRYPLKGLTGIQKERHPFIRPLIEIPKIELRQFLVSHHFIWAEDSTNNDLTILRNKTRKIIQQITPYWPTMEQSVIHLSRIIMENQELIDNLLHQALEQSEWSNSYFRHPYAHFKQQHPIVQRELIYHWFNQLMKGKIRADYRLPQKFVNSINLNPHGSILLRGHGFEIKRVKKDLIIQKTIIKEKI
ncbi:tRNA lysidine(34) synthetase TilS [Entomospira nematocerorum]|uniref:tRNA(Ile)-lysidine synthase n=1 Tax=Entomospira nematocerorum TaxID=2719987 RepID=A0A968GB94_9SPIO|nr:tRNA lysidine(34) synthetase TilS [Entomospira nematocera]NIZ46685.1 tRNA lysidine(34) synthetase TilS [Entomospira nematocera]WDI33518.1 tRNA lysidine(34) synthetase TilS [Entomospira nematocera]